MKPRALDLLVCPADKTSLELVKWEVSPVKLSTGQISRAERLGLDPALFTEEIVTGVLLNRSRKIFYPIHQGIPRLLVFKTGLVTEFAKKYAERIRS